MAKINFAETLDAVDASARAQGVDFGTTGHTTLTVVAQFTTPDGEAHHRTVQTYRRETTPRRRLPRVVRHRPRASPEFRDNMRAAIKASMGGDDV